MLCKIQILLRFVVTIVGETTANKITASMKDATREMTRTTEILFVNNIVGIVTNATGEQLYLTSSIISVNLESRKLNEEFRCAKTFLLNNEFNNYNNMNVKNCNNRNCNIVP